MKLPCRPFGWLFGLTLLTLALGACSAPGIDLQAWRAQQSAAGNALEPLGFEGALAEAERLRAADELEMSRRIALPLALQNSADPRAVLLASRAEADGLYLFPEDDKYSRNHCAASALDFAQRAAELGADNAADRAQLTWSLGITTHLQPMTERRGHASKTMRAARRALELDPEEPTALATLAMVHLRLQTLPWIAKLMTSDLPDSSLEEAESFARRAVAARPSRENRWILVKVLEASDKGAEARRELKAALAAPPQFPRDRVLEPVMRARLE